MIKLIVAEPGSGKTAFLMHELCSLPGKKFVNWRVYDRDDCIRLTTDMIFKETPQEDKRKASIRSVNWDFWKDAIEKHKSFHIFMDEIQQIVHARRAASHFNTLFSQWISQIRKVTGSNEDAHFYAVSQRLRNIDIAIRELATVIIVPEKWQGYPVPTTIRSEGKTFVRNVPRTHIRLTYFLGPECVKKYEYWREGLKSYDFRAVFQANYFFRFYNSYEFGDFGNMELL